MYRLLAAARTDGFAAAVVRQDGKADVLEVLPAKASNRWLDALLALHAQPVHVLVAGREMTLVERQRPLALAALHLVGFVGTTLGAVGVSALDERTPQDGEEVSAMAAARPRRPVPRLPLEGF